jgi:hypothetical protein
VIDDPVLGETLYVLWCGSNVALTVTEVRLDGSFVACADGFEFTYDSPAPVFSGDEARGLLISELLDQSTLDFIAKRDLK